MARTILINNGIKIAAFVVAANLLIGCGDSSGDLNAAQEYYKNREFSSAVIELKNVLRAERNNVAARKLLGEAYFQQGQFVAAEKELARAYQLDNLDPQIIFFYAKTLLQINNFEQFEVVLHIKDSWSDTEQSQGMSLRLLSFIKQNKKIEAVELVQSPRFSNVESVEATYAKAVFHLWNNQLQLSQELVTNLLEQNPNHLEGLLLQGDLHFVAKDYQNALTHYQKASELQPSNPRLQIKVVQSLIQQNEFQQAEKIVVKIVEQVPLYHEANYYYSYIKLQNKDYDTALTYANKVLDLIPNHIESQYLAAKAAYSLNLYEVSYGWSRKLAASFPKNNTILKLLAANQLHLKLHDKAMKTLTRVDDTQVQQQDASLFLEAARGMSSNNDLVTRKQLYLQAAKAEPNSTAPNLGLAAISFAQGSDEEANQYLHSALAKDPSSSLIKTALISSYLKNNQLDKAQSAIKELIANDKNNPDGYTLQGLLHIRQSNTELATEFFEKALTINPHDANANQNLAALAISANDLSLAKSRYEQILEADSGNLRALKQLWLLEKKLGNELQSQVRLKQAATSDPTDLTVNIALAEHYIVKTEYQSAIELLQSLANNRDNDYRIPFLLGQAYYFTNQSPLALTQFKRASELEPQDPGSHYWIGLTLEKNGNIDKAIIAANKALALAPENRLVLSMRLRLLMVNNNLELAGPLVEKLITAYPDDIVIQEYQAKFALQNHEYKKAVSLFKKLFKQRENNFTLVQLASALVRNDQHQVAIEKLESWSSRYPNDLLVLNLLANEYLNVGQLSNAKERFTTIVKLSPDNSLAQNNLAWLLFKDGKIALAQKHAEQAYKTSPQSPMINDTLGQILLAKGDYAKSTAMLKLASKKMPDNLETKFYLAKVTALNGDKSKARYLLQQILSSNTGKSEIELALRRNSQLLLAELE